MPRFFKSLNEYEEKTKYDFNLSRDSFIEDYPEYASEDYLWNKSVTENEIKNMDNKKIDFIYDTGISFLKEIENSIRSHQTRIVILLGYLFTNITGAMGFLLREGEFIPDSLVEYLAIILIFGYSILIILLVNILYKKIYLFAYSMPANFMKENVFETNLKVLKINEIMMIQYVTSINRSVLIFFAQRIKPCIIASVAIPAFLILTIVVVFVWENWYSWTLFN